jgi:membrane protease YdiL (CAAX protease family)
MRYLYLFLLIVAVICAGLGLQAVFQATGSGLSIYSRTGLGIILLYLTTIALVVGFLRLAAPGSLSAFFAAYRGKGGTALKGFATMFGLGLLMVFGLFVLLAITGHLGWHEKYGERSFANFLGKMAVGIVAACALAMSEEFIFRGFVMRYLRWNTTPAVTVGAVLASAFIFASAHNIADPLAWFTAREFPLFVGLFLLGILLAVTYLVTGSLWCSIGLHAGLVVLGELFLRRDIIRIDFSPWWMGGIEEIRMAPLVWLSFAVTTIVHIATRRDLHRRFGIEKPFVGTPPVDR